MADKTRIGWTDASWNPVTGCVKVSEGCDNCYAEAVTLRFKRGGPFAPGNEPTLHENRLSQPARWKRPRRIFVNSMSDLFWAKIEPDFLRAIWQVMLDHPRHTYQVLTKRPRPAKRLIERLGLKLAPHIWIGVSVENQYWADRRIPELLEIGAPVRFVSAEPMLGPLNLTEWLSCFACHLSLPIAHICPIPSLDWVITGGESGPKARPFDIAWARDVRDQCVKAHVPFFHKQHGGRRAGGDNRIDGVRWEQFPNMEP